MANNSEILIDRLYTVNTDAELPAGRKLLGRAPGLNTPNLSVPMVAR